MAGPALIVAVCAMLSAVMRVSIDSFAVFLLPLSIEFGWGRTEAVSIYSLTMLSFGFGCIMAGRLIDRIGPRWTYTAGLALIACAFIAASDFDTLIQFNIAMGVVIGLGGALIGMVSHGVVLNRWFSENLTLAISLTFSASGLGILVAAPLLQTMIEDGGWRTAYLHLGYIAAALALALPLLPWRWLEARDPDSIPRRVRHERGPEWRIWQELLSDQRLLALFGIQFLTALSVFAMNAQIVAFLIEQGFDSLHAATAFGAGGLAGTVGVIVFAWLADGRGRFVALSLSYLMSILGFGLLFLLTIWHAWWLVGAFILVYGPTFGSRGPIVNAMVPHLVGKGYGLGFKIGFVQLGFGIGAATGALTGGWLRESHGYESVIGLAMVAGAAALLLYWSMGTLRRA